MSELARVQSGFAKAQSVVSGSADDITENTLIYTGRTRLRSVILMDTSNGATVGVDSFCEFKNGTDSSGTSMLKLYPNLMGIFGTLLNSKALFVELPGNGILFDTGIFCTLSGTNLDATGFKSMSVTVLYG